MAGFILDGQEDATFSADAPLNAMAYEMVEFGEWQNTNVMASYLVNSINTIESWFNPAPLPERQGRVAICGYGPSLKDHLDDLRNGNYDAVYSTSGAHDVLLGAGVTPSYHVEIDWKEHKSKFTKNAHPDVHYLISATCHPDTIENVAGKKASLIFPQHGPETTYPDESYVLPWAVDVGQTACMIAKLHGWRNLDLFGFDYSYNQDGIRHAGPHGGRIHFMMEAVIEDRIFFTSKTMFTGILVFEHLMKQNPELNLVIHGDGMLINFMEARVRQDAALKEQTNG